MSRSSQHRLRDFLSFLNLDQGKNVDNWLKNIVENLKKIKEERQRMSTRVKESTMNYFNLTICECYCYLHDPSFICKNK